jgi:hypothetical protein
LGLSGEQESLDLAVELALQSALSNGKMLRISTGALHLSSSDLTTPKTLWGATFRLFLLTIAFDNFPD